MLKRLKSISLHPKLAAVFDLGVNLILLWWFKSLENWSLVAVWFGFRIITWMLLILVVYYPKEMSRRLHLLSLLGLAIGSLAFLLFIEWNFSWYLFGALYCALSFFSFWLLPASEVSLQIFLKPHVRWRFIMSAVSLAGIFQGAQAIVSFQIIPSVNSWVWLSSASVLAALFAGWWWWEYDIATSKRFWVWTGLWFLFMLELFWVVNLLPLPYLVSSLILIWCWYAAWLIVRFNLTPEGINWKKQRWFLISNSALFLIFLIFFAPWK